MPECTEQTPRDEGRRAGRSTLEKRKVVREKGGGVRRRRDTPPVR